MNFNSFNFLVFLPAVFILHWALASKKLSYQNNLLLLASYIFYSAWDYRLLPLLIFSTLLNYFGGKMIYETTSPPNKRIWFWLVVLVNVGVLAIFKYYNFFADSFSAMLSVAGIKTGFVTANIVLPVGISFYTFHGLSYIIDINKERVRPIKSIPQFALFMSFFPLLVSGPIERATHLLPQIEKKRTFDYAQAVDGLKQMLWGFFKKIVVADTCATYVTMLFSNPSGYAGSTLLLGAIIFSVQLYCDFSGYSDIALGVAKLFGIDLLRNFNYPLFSLSIVELWRRWHISLSSWFNDYFFTPLSVYLRNWGKASMIFSTMVTFLVIGLWHGPNWTYVVFGAIQGILISIEILTTKIRKRARKKIPAAVNTFLGMSYAIICFSLSCIFFRSATITGAFVFISRIFSSSFFSLPLLMPLFTILLLLYMIIVEWIGRKDQYAIQRMGLKWPRYTRWFFYYAMIFMVHKYFDTGKNFIYFQF